ncbi:hypothetical protein EIP86_006698 [Pleurotus ostreatoroseus]|nr:hypothetical protein EIP86_006698 [Pleurotus ostreatoroseus]
MSSVLRLISNQIPLTLTQLGFTFANNALTLVHRNIEYLTTITYTVYATHGVNVFLDLFFVIAMIILLAKERRSFHQTQRMVHRLLVVVINTGLITTLSTLLTLIFVGASPNTFIYAFFNILISPLYGNSVMANLNSRDYIRGGATHMTSLEMSALQCAVNSSTGRGTNSTTDVGNNSFRTVDGVLITKDTVTSQDYIKNYPIGYSPEDV